MMGWVVGSDGEEEDDPFVMADQNLWLADSMIRVKDGRKTRSCASSERGIWI
jgi:hypothetical protein